MRALPAGSARIERLVITPYRIAMMAQASARTIPPVMSTPYLALTTSTAGGHPAAKKRAILTRIPCAYVALWIACRPAADAGPGGSRSKLELGGELLRHRLVLEPHVLRQAVAVRRIRLADDQGRQIGAALLGDVEAVLANEVVRHELLVVGDIREIRLADHPAIGPARLAHDHGHRAVVALDRELHRGLADCVRLLQVGPGSDVAR